MIQRIDNWLTDNVLARTVSSIMVSTSLASHVILRARLALRRRTAALHVIQPVNSELTTPRSSLATACKATTTTTEP